MALHIGAHLGGGAAGVAVVEAIHVEVGGVRARAVDMQTDPARPGLRHHAGHQERQIGEVAAVERQVVDLLLHDHVALDGAVLGVQRRDLGGDLHRFGDIADNELDIGSQDLIDLQHDFGLPVALNPCRSAVNSYCPGGRLVTV